MMKTRHVDCPRSAIIVFRFDFNFGEVLQQASYADFAYAHRLPAPSGDCFRNRVPSESFAFCGASHGLACAPRTSLTPGCPVEKPAVSDATTGLNLSIFRFPPHGRPSSRGQLSLLDANYTKFTGLKSQCESQTYRTSVRRPSSFVLSCAALLATPCLPAISYRTYNKCL